MINVSPEFSSDLSYNDNNYFKIILVSFCIIVLYIFVMF